MECIRAANVGVGIESERLLVVLERTVDALELLALLPTPETNVSFASFLQSRDGDISHRALTKDAEETLATHFQLEASLSLQETDRLQRCVSTKAAHVISKCETEDDEKPEVEEEDKDEEQKTRTKEMEVKDEEDDEGWDHDDAQSFPRSLHNVLCLLTVRWDPRNTRLHDLMVVLLASKHDKSTRDVLRRLSATRISPDVAAFVHGLTDLIVLRERALSTTHEQDEVQQHTLREAAKRLTELHDDAAQLRFELTAERDARQTHALTHVQTIAMLREQLSETQRHATEALRATQRTRDQDSQALRAQFENDRISVHEKSLALVRVERRVADTHQAEEGDDRKRVLRGITDLDELLIKYDHEMAELDEKIADEMDIIEAQASDLGRLATYFERVDEDRHHALEEQRAREAEEAKRRRRDLNVFKLTTRLQALVRGFLARRQVRLEEQLRKRKKSKKKKQKAKTNGISSPRKPKRPTSAVRRAPRPSSAAMVK